MNSINTYVRTLDIINRYNFTIRKKYGQNFLTDQNILDRIIDAAQLTKEDAVLEIGPGIGTLTGELAGRAGKVAAVEIDTELIPILKETLDGVENVDIINKDILKLDLRSYIADNFGDRPVKVVANLPYYITTPIIMKLMEGGYPFKSITVMVQKEVAERMCAGPGSKEYGALSLAVRYYSNPVIITQVPPECFIPRPKVSSAVIRLDILKDRGVKVRDEELLLKLIRASFNQRRKTLVNAIANFNGLSFGKEEIREAIEKTGLRADIRGEALTLEEFAALADRLSAGCQNIKGDTVPSEEENGMEKKLSELVKKLYKKEVSEATNAELYHALLSLTKELSREKKVINGDRKVYYISAEFLIGKLLSNNLINLGVYDELEEILNKNGKSIAMIEEEEPEPSLGNGGLGRLAACFLDSIATLGLPGEGIGLNYHYGLFKQVFKDHLQTAEKNDWIEKDSWLNKTGVSFEVEFGGGVKVESVLYDIDVIGYDNGIIKLHLFDLKSLDEGLVRKGIDFDKEAVDKNLTLFLYPDDSDKAGNLLRIYQQYFMVSSGAQFIIKEVKEKGFDLYELDKHVIIQINDTHPTMVIPELIRILTQEEGFTMDDAVEVVGKTCAYTNHTILAEALEKWPLDYLEQVVPKLVPIIKELNNRIVKTNKDQKIRIIDEDKRVHMAHIDIHYGTSVNGVAAIHTDILKNTELNAFYKLYPEKFNNKTNGITFRRWLLSCNRELTALLDEKIGTGYKKNADELEKLLQFKDDEEVLNRLAAIKMDNKKKLAEHVRAVEGVELDTDSIFDIQIKRMHEYKRQQMNALYIIHKYLQIKAGKKPKRPITFIFGAKAAPAYVIAKDIIHLLLVLEEIVNKDPEVSPYLKVLFVTNYNVSYAEKLIPACDISEQISLASKEASGTGNMKFMLNGAVTLGTDDGANVEIHELVGDENIYIFGADSDTVIKHYEKADYVSRELYKKSPVIKQAVDFIISEKALKTGHKENLERLYKELLNKDWFMTLLDLESYIEKKDEALNDYEDQQKWRRMMLVNIAKAGFFSSDRTIEEYNRDIWKLKKV